MKTLVIGGTGNVGFQVVQQLRARKADVRVLTRNPSKAPTGVEAMRGDLADPDTLRPAFEGVDAIFMAIALGTSETHEGLMGVSVAHEVKVKRIVYVSVAEVDRHPLIPHFAAKVPVEQAIRATGIPFTILRPNSFIQNDLRYRDAMLQHGVYPQPLGNRGCSRVDVRDIGEVAAIALTQPGHEGRTYHVAGPRVETGDSIAAMWSEALGKPVRYFGNDLEAWGGMMRQWMPSWLVHDLKHMYAAFIANGLAATDEDLETMTRILKRPLRSSDELAKETAASWMAGSKASG